MKKEIINKISTLVISAFGLVAALAWNGAIQSIFREVFGTPDGIWSMITYALVVTVIAVAITIWIAKIGNKKE
jgi:uncharacterized membrane protein YidH (DUF202 family)